MNKVLHDMETKK